MFTTDEDKDKKPPFQPWAWPGGNCYAGWWDADHIPPNAPIFADSPQVPAPEQQGDSAYTCSLSGLSGLGVTDASVNDGLIPLWRGGVGQKTVADVGLIQTLGSGVNTNVLNIPDNFRLGPMPVDPVAASATGMGAGAGAGNPGGITGWVMQNQAVVLLGAVAFAGVMMLRK